jgi:peptidoglycan-associated lipoprotein
MLLFAGIGCAHKKTKEEEGAANAAVESTDLGNSDMGNAMGLESIHFDYDSNVLSQRARSILKKDASILKDHPNISIQVEGHCDTRGGIQYNIALGQRRADAVQHFLADQGISPSRLTTISFGKEKPLVSGDSDEAYAKNRRANLAITRK